MRLCTGEIVFYPEAWGQNLRMWDRCFYCYCLHYLILFYFMVHFWRLIPLFHQYLLYLSKLRSLFVSKHLMKCSRWFVFLCFFFCAHKILPKIIWEKIFFFSPLRAWQTNLSFYKDSFPEMYCNVPQVPDRCSGSIVSEYDLQFSNDTF